jgi:vancomycin resistance protein YoaR
MSMELQKQPQNTKPVKILIVSLIVLILLILAITGQFAYAALTNDKIYGGVFINDLDTSGFSKSELLNLLKENYENGFAETEIILKAEDKTKKILYSDFDVRLNISEAVENAYGVGRSGNIFKRCYQIFSAARAHVTIRIPVSYDREKLEDIVEAFYNETLISVKEADLLIQDGKVVIRSGHSGKHIDKDALISQIDSLVNAYKGGTIDVPVIITPPHKINVDDLYSQINIEPRDASFKVENNSVTVVPHVVGRSIEKSDLLAISEELDNKEDFEKELPVRFIQPKITTDYAKSVLFRDTLATMSTQFYTYDENGRNRSTNIRLASSILNGTVLAPGQVFSFNEVVGPRTEQRGFKFAHAFIGGKIVDEVGGGICQVSSTLYNAVLFSDLEVIERKNHTFTVAYVPKGQDATVSYGQADFKFRNSTRWPIKIKSWVTDDNRVHFSLIGTNDFPGKTVEINPSIVKTVKFDTVYIDDPNLPEGETKVKQEGMDGYVVDTYKIVKLNGQVISQTKLHTSVYRPLTQEIIRGTKKVEVTDENDPQPSESGEADEAEFLPEVPDEKPDETPGEAADDVADVE